MNARKGEETIKTDTFSGRVINRDTRYDEGGGSGGKTQSIPRNPRATKYAVDRVPYGPDEVLFRRKGAPQRYEEHDIYAAHVHQLPDRSHLPDSEMLKAMHSYASHFYSSRPNDEDDDDYTRQGAPGGGGGIDETSMDETALLAFGILLEEAGKETLGRRGHLVFTEGREERNEESLPRQVGLRVGPPKEPLRKKRKVRTAGD